MFRISQAASDFLEYVATVERIESAIRAAEPGRYHVDEFPLRLFPSVHTVRCWGIGIRHPDGSVEIEPDPWDR